MSSFGVTPEGFVRPSLEEIAEQRRQKYRDQFGSNINTAPASVFGQLIGIEAEREDRLWAAMQAVYLSAYPASASGRSLDGAVQLTGIERLDATRSFVLGVLIGVPSATIPEGSQASISTTNEIFETLVNVTLTLSATIQALVSVSDVIPSTTYSITIDGQESTYESSGDPDADEILNGLASSWQYDHGSQIDFEVDNGEMLLIVADRITPVTLSVGSNLQVDQVGNQTSMRSLNTGPILSPAGTLTTIETPVAGWDEVINYTEGTSGRNIETDSELRLRRAESLQITGTATVEAIRARLLAQVDDVTAVTVIENRTAEVDGDGRPPHSFEAVVSGGTDEDIANKIWEVKPAGIQTHGDFGFVITDSSGNLHEIRFSRPVDQYVWIRIDLSLNGVGTYPDNGEDTIKENILAYGSTLSVGDDLIIQALFGPIFSVPGIESAEVEIAVTSSPETAPEEHEYVSNNIAIGSNEIAIFASDRIEVEVVT